MTQRFRLLGDPVAHSISPSIHMAAFETWGVDAAYEAVGVSSEALEAALRDEEFVGGNVTVPHKLRAASILDEATSAARATGACNCFWWERGVLKGTNTDVGGFVRALEDMGIDPSGARVLLLSAGGAARAAVHALVCLRIGELQIRNRTPAKAHAFAAGLGPEISVLEGRPAGYYDLIVNATRVGLDPGDGCPIDLETVECGAVFDMVYAPGRTAWVREAEGRGLAARDGLSMLVHQASLSLQSWFPDRTPALDEMRRAAEQALEARISCH